MNYYIFTYKKRLFQGCDKCINQNILKISRSKINNKKYATECPANILDKLCNIFIKNSVKNITRQPLVPCLDSYYIDDLIYKLVL